MEGNDQPVQAPRFFDAVVECVDYIDSAEHDKFLNKNDVIDGVRARLSIMISQVLMEPHHGRCYSTGGWVVRNFSSGGDEPGDCK